MSRMPSREWEGELRGGGLSYAPLEGGGGTLSYAPLLFHITQVEAPQPCLAVQSLRHAVLHFHSWCLVQETSSMSVNC